MSLAHRIGQTYRDRDKLIPEVERYLLSRPVTTSRREDCIHPSEASHAHWCQRATYYRIIGTPVEVVPTTLMQEVVFETGHEAHHKWQGWFWKMGVLGGDWFCISCRHYWTAVSPIECPNCNAPSMYLQYREVPLRNDQYLLQGSSDGDHTERNSLLEFKTVGTGTLRFEAPKLLEQHGNNYQALWSSIRRPFPSHLKQGMLYLFCKRDKKSIIFIYEPKFLSAYPKEFEISYNESIIEEVLEKCLQVKRAVERHQTPKRPLWATKGHTVCARCPYRATCYASHDRRSDSQAVQAINRSTKTAGTKRSVPDGPSFLRLAQTSPETD